MSESVTLIIPVRNEGERLPRCLKGIKTQSLAPTELIVVDGHSTDNTVAIAEAFGAKVLYEDCGTRAAACQIGVQAARGEIVAFTDADCIPDSEWLQNLYRCFHGKAVGVGGKVVNKGDTFWERAVDLALDSVIGSANSVQGRRFKEKRKVSSISGCNSMYRREDIIAIGGFNTELPTAEDTELNRRLMNRGDLVYIPDAVVYHHHQRGLGAFAKRMMQYGVGRGMTLLPGAQLLLPVSLPVWLALVFLIPYFALLLLLAYLMVLATSSVAAGVRSRDPMLALALPIVYLVEHVSYSIGFWVGLAKKGKTNRRLESRSRGVLP